MAPTRGDRRPLDPSAVVRLHAASTAALALASGREVGWRWPPTADEREATDFVRAAAGHKVSGLLAPYADALGFPEDVAGAIRARARQVVMRSLAQARQLHEVLDRLQAAGIPALCLKGLATEAQTGRPIGDRGCGDLDIWVPTDQVARAIAALGPRWTLPAGYPEPGPSWAWRHWLRWGTEIPLSGPALIDLHWGLSGVRAGLPDFATAWAERASVDVSGRAVATLSSRHALLHACRHAEVDRWRFLRNVVDVSLLAARVEPVVVPGMQKTLGVVSRAVGLPDGWAVDPAPPRRWAEAVDEQRHLGSHGVRTAALSRPAYLWRVVRRLPSGRFPPARDVARVGWLVVLPPPWSLGSITTRSATLGVARAVSRRIRTELTGAVDRRRRR